MKVLQVCNKSPYPPHEGGSIAMNNITQGLIKAGHSVKVIAMSTDKHPVHDGGIPVNYKKKTSFESVFIDTRVKVFAALLNLFSKKSYNTERFISNEFSDKLKQVLTSECFDIIQLESIYTTPYISMIREYSTAKIVLRAHNIEHFIWERLALGCGNPLKKLYIKYLAGKLSNYENNILRQVDGIAAISQVDATYFEQSCCGKPVISIPVGIDQSRISLAEKEREFPGLFHLGSMDWMPNQEGIKWFLENVWTQLAVEYPQLHLYLAGRNMPEWLWNTRINGLIIQGEVKDSYEYMQSRVVMIVPLLSGSGMRVKIIEGMAHGNTIISTSIGAEGIHYTDGTNILIADKPGEFITQIKKCMENPGLCMDIGHQAKKLIADEYDNDVITGKLIQFYANLLHSFV